MNNQNMCKKIKSLLCLTIFILLFFSCGQFNKITSNPEPVVVSNGGDNSSTRLGEYSINVWAEIRNDGTEGDIVFDVTVTQNGNQWKKTKKKHFTAKETSKMELQFDEVVMSVEKPKYQISVYSY